MKDKEEWAMYCMYSLLFAMLRYKAFPGTRTEREAITALKDAAPYFGEHEIKKLDNLLSRSKQWT